MTMLTEEQLKIAEHWLDVSGHIAPEFDRKLIDEYRALSAENAALKAEVTELQMHTYCAYCGTAFDLDKEDSPRLVGEHIKTCKKHPMRKVEQERDWLKLQTGWYQDDLNRLRDKLDILTCESDTDKEYIGMLTRERKHWETEAIEFKSQVASLTAQLAEMTTYADKLATTLPALPKDVENLRTANAEFAQINFDLQGQVKALTAERAALRKAIVSLWPYVNQDAASEFIVDESADVINAVISAMLEARKE
jgi:chromosome segregation ATPase